MSYMLLIVEPVGQRRERTEAEGHRAYEQMLRFADTLKARGVPLDGVGMQMHLIAGQLPSRMAENFARFAALGLKLHVTELDVRVQTPATAASLQAQAQTYRSEARESRQDYRIHRSARRGDLTPREYRQLQRQQHRIDRAKRHAGRDGYVSPRERRQIERMQNRASKNIYRKSNNGRGYY